jgi:hypothetical protein
MCVGECRLLSLRPAAGADRSGTECECMNHILFFDVLDKTSSCSLDDTGCCQFITAQTLA